MILIKNGEVYSPKYLGKKDLLICGNKIEYIEDKINISEKFPPLKVIDAKDKIIFPGFIDCHVHILGGGGEGGFATRTCEIDIDNILEGGVTTVVGCLGTDGIARDMKSLLAKAKSLEEQGITTYIYTGSYKIPPNTLMGSIEEDIMLIDKIIGVGEIALSDHRGSQPSLEKLIELTSEARRGGILSKKSGIVNVHIGDGKDKLSPIIEVIKNTEIPITQFLPTHVNRNRELFEEGILYASKGGKIDFTTSTVRKFLEEGEVKCSRALKIVLENDVDIDNVSFSSDAQGSLPMFDDKGNYVGNSVGNIKSLYNEVRDAILQEHIKIQTAIKVITSNPADTLNLNKKGRIKEDNDGDITIVNKGDFTIDTVIAKGKIVYNSF